MVFASQASFKTVKLLLLLLLYWLWVFQKAFQERTRHTSHQLTSSCLASNDLRVVLRQDAGGQEVGVRKGRTK